MENGKNAQKCPKVIENPLGNSNTKTEEEGTEGSKINLSSYRDRKLCFTSFDDNPPNPDIVNELIDEDQVKYICYGEEVCPTTQKKHYQGYCYFYGKVSIRKAKKVLGIDKGWFQYAFGSFKENLNYCSKDGKFTEWGTRPAQGKRKDLNELKDDILNGKATADTIAVDRPMMFHQYGRTLQKLEDIRQRKLWRNFMTEGIWYYGSTGVGKSHKAFEDYHPDTHYNLINDNGWWDGYNQQETVIINDFRGWIPYDVLLTIVDKWVYNVKRRNREPMPFLSKKVIITSSLHPSEVYCNRDKNDKIEQLLRRFKVIKLENEPANAGGLFC